jgi:hypothetical protein
MVDLIDSSHVKHHELYRTSRLKELEFDDNDDNVHLKPMTLIDVLSVNYDFFNVHLSFFFFLLKVYNKRLEEFIADVQSKDTELKEGFIKKIRSQEAELKSFEVVVSDSC